MSRLHAQLLGGFELLDDDGSELKLATRKARALLALLIAEADKWHTRDRLSGLLWSDRQQAQARHSLTQALGTIRRLGDVAGITLLETESDRVRLNAREVEADLMAFRAIAVSDPMAAAELYRGPLLDGVTAGDTAFDDWLAVERASMHQMACSAFEAVLKRLAEVNDLPAARDIAARWLGQDHLSEAAHRGLIDILWRSDDRAGAIQQYRSCEQILRQELGVDPSSETVALLDKIRLQVPPDQTASEMALAPIVNWQLPDKPSIAVLPFENMSGDPEQEYFADGIAEDVITALSRFRSLFVIARTSSFTYKGGAVGITRVGRELGVRYVVEGSVRKAGNRVRITAQLIDATSSSHLWADRFDGSLDDVFDLQDQITEQIVVAVEPEIQTRERARARRKPPESLDAWELAQRGLSYFYRVNKTDRAEAIRLFKAAIALAPEFAVAHAYLAQALWASVVQGYAEDTAKAIGSARASAEQAISLDPNEPMAHYALGRVHTFTGETEMAIGEMQTAIAINPNFARGHFGLGQAFYYGAGQAEQALPHYDVALRLSPRDPLRWSPLMFKGSALRILDRHDEAIAHCRQACQVSDCGWVPHTHLAAALAEAGQKSEAQAAVEKAMQLQPALSISFIRIQFVSMHKTTSKNLFDSLRKAGVPE